VLFGCSVIAWLLLCAAYIMMVKQTWSSSVYVCSIWDWEQCNRLSAFSARNPRHTRITYSEFINSHDQALLLTGAGLYSHLQFTVCHISVGLVAVDVSVPVMWIDM